MQAVEIENISKKFGSIQANSDVSISITERSIHAIVGENGAGKSTIMNILYGLYYPDSGSIKIFGDSVKINTSSDAINLGIGMVHQHFMLIDNLTVIENIILGAEEVGSFYKIDMETCIEKVSALVKEFKLKIDLHAKISELPVGVQQKVEILKALYRKAKILILDEPTAVLTPIEVGEFFETLKKLIKQGKTVIIITHKLPEVKDISDTLTIMKQGKVVAHRKTAEISIKDIARMMVGREVLLSVEKPEVTVGDTVLELKKVCVQENNQNILKRYFFGSACWRNYWNSRGLRQWSN